MIIKLRAIGDVLLSTPVLPNIRRRYPEAKIHFLLERPSREVLEGNPFVDRVIVHPRNGSKGKRIFRSWIESAKFIQKLRAQKYDLVLDLFGNPRSAFLTLLTGAPIRVGFGFRGRQYAYHIRVKPRGDSIHEVEFNLDALRALNIPIKEKVPYFPLPSGSVDRVNKWIEEKGIDNGFLAALHPWGSWEAKRWDLVRFAALADRLSEVYQAKIIVLWGPGEKAHAVEVQRMAKVQVILAPDMNLTELGALLVRCRLVVANDSGPMHIATAVGTPTVGIFGPTNWKLQGPYDNQHAVVYKKGLSCIGCNRLECSDMRCMKTLEVEEVMEAVGCVLHRK